MRVDVVLTKISFCLLSDSRVQSYLLASLESSQHKTPPPLPGGLLPVSKELKELTVRFSRLVNFNKLVCSPFYQKILNKILTREGGPWTSFSYISAWKFTYAYILYCWVHLDNEVTVV